MKKKYSFTLVILLLLISSMGLSAQNSEKPKLVVGIVVDQMRFDYLYRFNKYYGEKGFRRLMNEGANFTFAHYNYVPTYTAPGHASVYTGSTPFYHGIIGNNWFDRDLKKMIYCVNDTLEKSVGSNDSEGEMSPRRLSSTTITDQLKLATNGRSKVISVSLKDRAAILPGGHWADGAYWYNSKTGAFITSSYYMKSLPEWVDGFNKKKLAEKYLSENWNLSNPELNYQNYGSDEAPNNIFSQEKSIFPHVFKNVKSSSRFELLESTPFGNEIVKEFAKAALLNEKLGKGAETDFLAISFSATDYVGHAFGTYSLELEDTYIKLDGLIAELLQTLDKQIGKGNYLVFLTADHAGEDTPNYLKKHQLPVGGLNYNKSRDSLKAFSLRTFDDEKIIENYSNNQIYINRQTIQKRGLDFHNVIQLYSDYLRKTFPEVSSILTRDELEKEMATRNTSNMVQNGFNTVRSGDIAFTLQPGYLINYLDKGTTHGAPYSYDTHIPLLFYGWHVPKQLNNNPVYVVDIAATIADILKITEPSANLGVPLIK